MDQHSHHSQPFNSKPTTKQSSNHISSSAYSSNANANEDWTKISDLAERRRIQNRIAQRNYRKKIKRRLEDLERRANSSSPSPEITPMEIAPTQPQVRNYNFQQHQTMQSTREKHYHHTQGYMHIQPAAHIESQYSTSHPYRISKETSALPLGSCRPSHQLERFPQQSHVRHSDGDVVAPESHQYDGQGLYTPFSDIPLPNTPSYDYDAAGEWTPYNDKDELPYFRLEYGTTDQDEIDRIQSYQASMGTVNDPTFFYPF